MLTPTATVKVLDFGLAKAIDGGRIGGVGTSRNRHLRTSRRPGPALILGTAAYMSPEQARGRRVDRRADVWAFGACSSRCSRAGRLRRRDGQRHAGGGASRRAGLVAIARGDTGARARTAPSLPGERSAATVARHGRGTHRSGSGDAVRAGRAARGGCGHDARRASVDDLGAGGTRCDRRRRVDVDRAAFGRRRAAVPARVDRHPGKNADQFAGCPSGTARRVARRSHDRVRTRHAGGRAPGHPRTVARRGSDPDGNRRGRLPVLVAGRPPDRLLRPGETQARRSLGRDSGGDRRSRNR